MTGVVMFYIISAVILSGALLAVTTAKIFRSAVWLLFSLTGIAALYFWLDLLFLAAVQIVVYIGGITVLIIFSIFLTERTGEALPVAESRRKAFSAVLAVAGFMTVYSFVRSEAFTYDSSPLNADVASIGRSMLSTGANGFALPFEAVSVLLLASMVGCIAIALKTTSDKI